jgi:flagellar motor switch protein FliN
MSDAGALFSPSPKRDIGTSGITSSFGRVPVTMQIMLGSAKIPLAELLELKAGSHFELEQKLGEPVIVIVNGCKIAQGELFVLDGEGDKLGVKITELPGGTQIE